MTAFHEVTIGNARDRATTIYALCEVDGTPRYVGKTVRLLSERRVAHFVLAKKPKPKLPVHRWIAKRLAAERPPVAQLIETVEPGADWAARERFWINEYRRRGFDLLNLTDGGEGLAGHVFTPEHREAIAAGIRTGKTFACETCGAGFWRKQCDIKKGECRFCSRDCYAKSLRGVTKPMPALALSRSIESRSRTRREQRDCKRGHPLSGDNLFITSSGSRGCKECRKIHKATYLGKLNG